MTSALVLLKQIVQGLNKMIGQFPKPMQDLILSLFVGIFVAASFENYFLDLVSSTLFKVFMPGIMVVMMIGGGREESGEALVVIGVALQMMLIMLYIRTLIKWCKPRNNNGEQGG